MAEEDKNRRDVVVVVEHESQLLPLVSSGYRLAEHSGQILYVLVVRADGDTPAWMSAPEGFNPEIIEFQVITADKSIPEILRFLKGHKPAIVVFCLPDKQGDSRNVISERLDPLLSRIKAPTALLRIHSGHSLQLNRRSIMVPFFNTADSHYALNTALALESDASVVIISVVPEPIDSADRAAQEKEFEENLRPWASDARVTTKLLRGDDLEQLLIDEAKQHDAVLVAASRGNVFVRAVLGDNVATMWRSPVQRFLAELDKPLILLRQHQRWFGALVSRLFATGDKLLPTLSREEQIDVYRQIRRAARPRQDFFIMMGLSSAIAGMGLIMNSPAIIIGAMLIAPLMSAIIGVGLAVVQGDLRFLGLSVAATLRGAAIAIFVGFLIGVLDFDRDVTHELLSRSAPTLLDLIVAMVSGIAAGYAMCRKDVSASLPGVAIAVALVPPLATVGVFLGMGFLPQAYGALLLFLTNLAAIVFASGTVFALLGFRPPHMREQDEKRLKIFARSALGAAILVLIVFTHLSYLSYEKATESGIERTTREVLAEFVAEQDELMLIDWGLDDDDRDNLIVAVDFASPEPLDRARISRLANLLAGALGTGIELTVLKTPAVQVTVTKLPED